MGDPKFPPVALAAHWLFSENLPGARPDLYVAGLAMLLYREAKCLINAVFVLRVQKMIMGLCRVEVEASTTRLVVAFVEDNGIFAPSYFRLKSKFCQTVSGGLIGHPGFGQGH